MSIRSEINMMINELISLGVEVKRLGPRCTTVAGDHHDYKTNPELHAYLTGCLVFVHSRPFDNSPTDTDTTPQKGS